MPRKALELLLQTVDGEVVWLSQKASHALGAGNELVAREYQHRANNLQAVLDGYQRLAAHEIASTAGQRDTGGVDKSE